MQSRGQGRGMDEDASLSLTYLIEPFRNRSMSDEGCVLWMATFRPGRIAPHMRFLQHLCRSNLSDATEMMIGATFEECATKRRVINVGIGFSCAYHSLRCARQRHLHGSLRAVLSTSGIPFISERWP